MVDNQRMGATFSQPRQVCFVADRWGLDRILELPRERFDGVALVPLKFDLYLLLKNKDYLCIDVFEHLEDDTIRGFFVESGRLTQGWREGLEAACVYRGYVLPVVDQLSLFCFFHDAVFAGHIIRDTLDRNRPVSGVVLLPNLQRPQELFRSATDVVTAIARWMAEQHNIPVTTLDLAVPEQEPLLPLLPRLPSEKVPERPPAPLPRLSDLLKNRILPKKSRPRVLLVLEGLTGQVAPQLGKALSEECDVTFVTTWATWEEMEQLSAIGDVLPIGLPYKLNGDAHKTRFAAARERLRDNKVAARNDHPEIFLNPHLDYQFDSLMFRRWPELCEYLDLLDARLDGKKFDTAILCNSLSAQGIAFYQAMKGRCPRILIPHSFSLVSNWNLTELDETFRDCETVAASFETERFMVEPVSRARFRTTGTVLFPDFSNSSSYDAALTAFVESCRARGQDTLDRHGLAGKTVALVITNDYTDNIGPCLNGRKNLEAFRALFDLTPEVAARLHFVIKPKTEEWDSGSEFFRAIVAECAAAHCVTVLPTAESLFDLAAACDFSVGVSANTSGYLYPILCGRPLLHTQTTGIFNGDGRFYPASFYVPDASFETVTTLDAVRSAVRRLALDQPARRAAGERGRAALLSAMPLDPGTRFRAVVKETIGR